MLLCTHLTKATERGDGDRTSNVIGINGIRGMVKTTL